MVSSGGAIAFAICEPVLMIEVGRPRSFSENQLWVILMPEVKNGDSAIPAAYAGHRRSCKY
jgi:hypothetical protein